MTINYTTLLGLAEPVTGTQSGTWGDDVNKGITDYLDIAIAGTQTISGSQTAVTLSVTNGSSSGSNISQAGSGSTGSAQYAIINCTGNPASLLTITVPASSRIYHVINATSTSQSVKIVGAGPTTGVTIVSGEKATVAWNGSDYVKISNAAGAGVFTSLTDSGLTSGRVTLATTGGLLTDSANLTFDGTNLSISGSNAVTLSATQTLSNKTLASGTVATTQAEKTADTTIATTAFADRLRSLTTPTTGTTGTLVVGDRGALVSATGTITVPASVFAARDVVTIVNNSASAISIAQGSGLTMYLVGSATTGNRTLAQRGIATVVFTSATAAVISGGGLS